MMNRQKFIKLFSKKISGEIDANDLNLLNKTVIEDEHYSELAGHLENYLGKQNIPNNSDSQHQLNQVWTMIDGNQNGHLSGKYNYSEYKGSISSPIWIKAAAALIVISCGGLLLYKLSKMETSHEFEQLTTREVKTFKMLDDGTKVWLNKHSTLNYNKGFGVDAREITIEGEAYFDVVKNNRIPLYVHAGNIDIEVKGTAFNVKAEKGNKDIEVALLRGLIQISDRLNKNSSLLLHPNQKIVYNTWQKDKNKNLQLKLVNPSALLNETKWIADTLVFRKEKLKDLARKMEKKYDVRIDIQSEALKEKHFSGIFINETIEQAITSLKLSYPLTYTINKRLVVIKGQE
ncbi:FecR family protein [Pedobacter sp. Leaf176]|uniref:FecR family protein n=1 Tax=Pedobacter sp. Leaf176 TaxID=1736286 RepID=UPI000AEE1E9F|nr:FecR family protein [Pedobacter sp. Leaf176]